jgi:tetratricopeptide (TPR) repeat protein
MAGNRKAFEKAMQAAVSAAWDQKWDKAIANYQRALSEFPRDASALLGLGMAYSGAGQLEAALDAYQRASDLAPDDPALLERIGQTREQLSQRKEAAEAYLASAERYLSQRQTTHLALDRWQDAARVWPDSLQAHTQLLRYYQAHGQARDAVGECLALVRIYEAQGKMNHAIRVCEHALKLSPRDPEVLTVLNSLRYGEQAAVEPEAEIPSEETEPLAAIEEPSGPVTPDLQAAPETEAIEERGSPIDITRQKALSDLAESFFEEDVVTALAVTPRLSKAEIDTLIGRAIDFQTRGKIEEAIDAYERVIAAGVDQPAVHFNLGLLYQEKLRFDAAISQFERTVSHPEYTLGSHFAMGECYRARGRIDEALEHFIEVLKIVDLATVQRAQADDLNSLTPWLPSSANRAGKTRLCKPAGGLMC